MAEMKSEKTERCLQLCEQGANEHDRQNFHDIIRELNRPLSKKREHLDRTDSAPSPAKN
jgi:hypothetical protein